MFVRWNLLGNISKKTFGNQNKRQAVIVDCVTQPVPNLLGYGQHVGTVCTMH